MMHIAVLVNPLSGKGKAVKTGKWLTNQMAIRNIGHTLYSTGWPGSLENFSEVWIVGGDGTINFFLNKYKANKLPLVLFKGEQGMI